MRIHVTELKEGDTLSNDTFNSYGLHVLSKGTNLFAREISQLFQHQIDYVDIELKPEEPAVIRTLESGLSPKWLPTVEPIYQDAVNGCEQLFMEAFHKGTVDEADVVQTFQPLVENFKMERDVVSMLLLLNTKDDYTYQHSVQVGMLSYYLASWLNYSEEEAIKIGQAGFLHDIGNCQIQDGILNKPDKLSSDEFETVKHHTLLGHRIITDSIGEESLAAAVALDHHERIDGSGYPNGKSGSDIHPAAKIVAVADVYSAMISTRVYQDKRDLLFVLRELYRMSFTELDPETTHTFIRHMIPNFIGKQVELDSGKTGTIIMTNSTEFFRPLIRTEDGFIDMAVDRSLEILHVYL
ncbi:HD-GYP domain-containing protein [Paenibacillus sacheonensis]|uniref:HD domain-containing protein n=1 Tax=Paenibacillus sacheonensis TaxID=742054 RepID=A0A7X4YNL9_9BACL|nr:HD-GYP domain-containing protein [Paenibacillus sacheonensis]MBM7565390.1 HD-GYP domain-containing protein (c-di-GMP phosphodiesterase class II) [Paenibacillus sacheonensis]NBC69682.1 HD domain-containing protein [Paenibacillus sacheonensis]